MNQHSDHSHHHDHAHGHHHHHGPAQYNRAFAIGISLNIIIVVLQGAYGYWAHSLALMADAGHNLSDVLGLLLAWGATVLSMQKPSRGFTYGLRGSSILAALANAIILLIAVGGIAVEAIQRFHNPEPVASTTVMIVAFVGIIVNGLTAYLFMSGKDSDLNLRGAYLHMLADTLVSVGVVVAGLLIYYTDSNWIDPVVSLLICITIIWSTWGLLKDSVKLALSAVPSSIDHGRVLQFLKNQKGVTEVHDLHIWGLSTTQTALTVHLIMPNGHPGDSFLRSLAHDLEHEFKITHVTIQIELGNDSEVCALASDEVV